MPDKQVRLAPLPADLTTCQAEPEAPALPAVDWTSIDTARPLVARRDALVLSYLLDLRGAGGDCRAKVAGANAWNQAARR